MLALADIADQVHRVAPEFPVKSILLFGSYAEGRPTADSDVDLLVIMPFEGRALRQSHRILNDVNPDFPADLLTRRPDDTRRRYQEGDALIREALDRGKVLYERHDAGVVHEG